jgi:hypothetical protein
MSLLANIPDIFFRMPSLCQSSVNGTCSELDVTVLRLAMVMFYFSVQLTRSRLVVKALTFDISRWRIFLGVGSSMFITTMHMAYLCAFIIRNQISGLGIPDRHIFCSHTASERLLRVMLPRWKVILIAKRSHVSLS